MKQVYQADDGTIFDTEASCKEYENGDALYELIEDNIGVRYNDGAGFHCIEADDVKTFINTHINDIIRIVKGGTVVTGAADEGWGWISNEGNSSGSLPDGISGSTLVVIKYRNGGTHTGYADNWNLSWCSTDNHFADIVAYRVVK